MPLVVYFNKSEIRRFLMSENIFQNIPISNKMLVALPEKEHRRLARTY
jgi:hypothetical protein